MASDQGIRDGSSVKLGIRALVGLAAMAMTAAAFAQGVFRTLPEDAPRGYLTFVADNLVKVDSTELRLAPGAQIRGANNLIVLPAALPGNSLVKYQLDRDGALFRAWVLTAEEAAKPDRNAPAQLPWATSPEPGRSIDQLLGTKPESRLGLRPGEQPPAAPAAPGQSSNP
jgi:hypothetical protein